MQQSSDPLVDCAKACELVLSLAPKGHRWAELFVDLKMWFFRKHCRGLICSTSHGTDWFTNIIGLAEGTMEWKEEGEYGNNFRKLVKERPRTSLTPT